MSYQFDVRISANNGEAIIKINHAAFSMTRDDARHETVEYYQRAGYTDITVEHISKVGIANACYFDEKSGMLGAFLRAKKKRRKKKSKPRITGNDPVITV